MKSASPILVLPVLVCALAIGPVPGSLHAEEQEGYQPFAIKQMDPGNDGMTQTRVVVRTTPRGFNLYSSDAPGCLFDFGAGNPGMFNPGAEHVFVERNTTFGVAVFDSQVEYPLTFRLVAETGFVYLCGRGSVTMADGKKHDLGVEDTIDTWLPRLDSAKEPIRAGAALALGWLAKTDAEKQKVSAALVKAMGDADADVRRAACESLGRIKLKASLAALKALEADKSERCKITAKWAVAQIDTGSADLPTKDGGIPGPKSSSKWRGRPQKTE